MVRVLRLVHQVGPVLPQHVLHVEQTLGPRRGNRRGRRHRGRLGFQDTRGVVARQNWRSGRGRPKRRGTTVFGGRHTRHRPAARSDRLRDHRLTDLAPDHAGPALDVRHPKTELGDSATAARRCRTPHGRGLLLVLDNANQCLAEPDLERNLLSVLAPLGHQRVHVRLIHLRVHHSCHKRLGAAVDYVAVLHPFREAHCLGALVLVEPQRHILLAEIMDQRLTQLSEQHRCLLVNLGGRSASLTRHRTHRDLEIVRLLVRHLHFCLRLFD